MMFNQKKMSGLTFIEMLIVVTLVAMVFIMATGFLSMISKVDRVVQSNTTNMFSISKVLDFMNRELKYGTSYDTTVAKQLLFKTDTKADAVFKLNGKKIEYTCNSVTKILNENYNVDNLTFTVNPTNKASLTITMTVNGKNYTTNVFGKNAK